MIRPQTSPITTSHRVAVRDVLVFDPFLLCCQPEMQRRIHRTSGSFPLRIGAQFDLSPGHLPLVFAKVQRLQIWTYLPFRSHLSDSV